jgi:hypothetical protein
MNLGRQIKLVYIPERVPAHWPIEVLLRRADETLAPLPANWPRQPCNTDLQRELRLMGGPECYGCHLR